MSKNIQSETNQWIIQKQYFALILFLQPSVQACHCHVNKDLHTHARYKFYSLMSVDKKRREFEPKNHT